MPNRKVPYNHGFVIDELGNIKKAWAWYSTPVCPLSFDMPNGWDFIECSGDEHKILHENIHLYQYDKKGHKISHKLNGTDVLKLKPRANSKPT